MADAGAEGSAVRACPEIETLLLAARTELSPQQAERLRALVAAGLDWDVLPRLATYHRLVPLLSRHLRAAAPDLAPAEALSSLRERARQTLIGNMALVAGVRPAIEELERRGMEPILVKGPAVAQSLYGSLGLRPFGDVDILVAPERAAEAWDVLAASGYSPFPAVPVRRRERLIRHHYEQAFSNRRSQLTVDLHWRLFSPGFRFGLSHEELRSRTASVVIAGATWCTPGAEDSLLFLALHGAKHDWSCLGWLCDLAQLLRGTAALDWDRVAQWSSTPGPRRPLQLALHLASRLLEAPVPATVLSQGARDPTLGPIVERATATLLSPSPWPKPRPGLRAGLVDSTWYRSFDRRCDRVRHLYYQIVRPMPADMIVMPGWLPYPALFLTRPVRLVWRQASRVVGPALGRVIGRPARARHGGRGDR